MLERIVSVLFPVFAITAVGWFVARRGRPDMSHANRLTMDVFMPALVFGALSSKEYHVGAHLPAAWAMFAVTVLIGIIGWLLARASRSQPRTLVPPMMFGNSANLGIPVALLAFGEESLQVAIVLFMVSSLVHFSFGAWLLDRKLQLGNIWRVPTVLACLAGVVFSLMGWQLWGPLHTGIRMLGDIAIPLMLFSLGVRLTDVDFSAWRLGLLGGIARPVFGMLLSWLATLAFGLQGLDAALLILYGAMPPAVLNYIFAERYHQEPHKVASIVLLGNLLSVAFLPLALALTLH